jgi:hypothetical protein
MAEHAGAGVSERRGVDMYFLVKSKFVVGSHNAVAMKSDFSIMNGCQLRTYEMNGIFLSSLITERIAMEFGPRVKPCVRFE